MSALTCPGCGDAMSPLVEPDVTIDECPSCHGTWLDAGELNALATGLAGDIEYVSTTSENIGEDAPDRDCPRCAIGMAAVNLMRCSDVVFDHCQKCGGFYLDRGEVEAMNNALLKISRAAGGDEFRGTIGGHLVRVDRETVFHVVQDPLGLGAEPNEEQTLSISVYYDAALGRGLRIYEESLSTRIAKALLFFAPQDIKTGDGPFDKAFVVQGKEASAIKALLTDKARQALLQLKERAPAIYSHHGSLEVLDDRAVYVEGPYSVDADNSYDPGIVYDAEEDPEGIVTALLAFAGAVDGTDGGDEP